MKTSIINSKQIEKVCAIVIALLVWHLAAVALGQEILLVSPIRVIQQLSVLCREMSFWQSILFTLTRIVAGFLSAMIMGTILGVIAARVHILEVLLWPYMDKLR